MQVREKLTYQFVAIVALILLAFSGAVYYFSADYREETLYDRLKSRAVNVANLLINIDEVDSATLQKIEKNNPLSLPDEKIIVYNYKNQILFSTDHKNVFKISPKLLDDVRLNQEVRFEQKPYEMLGFLYTSKYDRFVVISGAIDVYGFKKLDNLSDILVASVAVCIIITFIAGSIYSRRALRPISGVINQVDNITASSMNLRVDEGNKKDEIAKLAETFNKMLGRLEGAFLAQKNFIANASHELRTPLTVISGQLQVLLLRDRTAEDYKKNIASVLDDVKNLNLIADRLLLLMQASVDTSVAGFTSVRVDEILWQAKKDITQMNDVYTVIITFDPALDENHLTVSGNEQLIRSAVFNLLENGCKFSRDHKTEVHLTTHRNRLTMIFTDKGIGIPAEELEFIFQPFRRGTNSTHIKGHGIGLSLVEKIIRLHKGSIDIKSEVNTGTVITISFSYDIFNSNLISA
ncbi:MAG TPA: ATP-binding protein [Parafilimonas sp.]|nr:ATP-binding protein [Parafilimonas sp.]